MQAAPDRRSDFWQILGSRRMCRSFEPDPLDDQTLETLVRSAFRGPSAGNTSGLDLLVLVGEDIGSYWDVTLPAERRDGFRWPGLLNAPALLIPVVDPDAYVERYGRPDKTRTGLGVSRDAWPVPYWFVDGGAAVMSILLTAEALDLGALFFGQFEHESALCRRFDVPEARRTLGTVAVGHPAADGRRPSRSAAQGRPVWFDHTHFGSWGQRD